MESAATLGWMISIYLEKFHGLFATVLIAHKEFEQNSAVWGKSERFAKFSHHYMLRYFISIKVPSELLCDAQ